jgi:hypothetical protein
MHTAMKLSLHLCYTQSENFSCTRQSSCRFTYVIPKAKTFHAHGNINVSSCMLYPKRKLFMHTAMKMSLHLCIRTAKTFHAHGNEVVSSPMLYPQSKHFMHTAMKMSLHLCIPTAKTFHAHGNENVASPMLYPQSKHFMHTAMKMLLRLLYTHSENISCTRQ